MKTIFKTVILGVERPSALDALWWAARASPRTAPDSNSYLLSTRTRLQPLKKEKKLTSRNAATRPYRLGSRTLHRASLSTAPSIRWPASPPR
jgi:hypothetical protein